MRSNIPSSAFFCCLEYATDTCMYEVEVIVLGGYRCGSRLVVLYRSVQEEVEDKLMEIIDGEGVAPSNDAALNEESNDWHRYAEMLVGATFRLGGKDWTKLSAEEVGKTVHRKWFTLHV